MNIEDINKQALENPLSKEECKKQFIEKTKELNLKHSFTFDEAWEIGKELRRRQEFRDRITELHDQVANSEVSITGKDLHDANPTKHTFAGGCYVREIFNPADELIITRIHKKEHPFFLLKGKMSIITENGLETIEAPHQGVTKPGTKRIIYTHTDCVFTTVHATDKTTVDAVEKEVVAEDFNDKDISLNDKIKEINEMLNVDIKLIKYE
tara:strand:- start:2855 stop:3484 length:630 start_codon:yes stop_codon:yes gene_type:complete